MPGAEELRAELVELIARARSSYEPEDALHRALHEVEQRLAEPLRIAVVGRISAGKSTVVNALVGERVAPTDAGECTRVVTFYRYGRTRHYEIHWRSGRMERQVLPAGQPLPADIGPAREIDRIEVHLSSAALRDLTVIDTPGLESPDTASSEATLDAIAGDRTRQTVTLADGLLWVFDKDALLASEEQMIENANTQRGMEVLALLSKADLGRGTDPLGQARRLAQERADDLSKWTQTVLPVVGLIAETVLAGGFTQQDADSIRQLAALDSGELAASLRSIEAFERSASPIERTYRVRLIERLGLFGTRMAIEAARREARDSARLRDYLLELSGFESARSHLEGVIHARREEVKLVSVLAQLGPLLETVRHDGPGAVRELANRAEALTRSSPMKLIELRKLEATTRTWKIPLGPTLRRDLDALLGGGDPAVRVRAADPSPDAIADAAREAVNRWRTFQNRGSLSQAQLAELVLEQYEDILERTSARLAGRP